MRFLARYLVGVALALAGMALATAIFLARANELRPFAARHVETEADILWGPLFGQQWETYKLRRTLYVRPDLLVMGSSRTNQFRAPFAPGVTSYNASLAASSANGALQFGRALYRRHRPRAVLLAVDPWWFDPARVVLCEGCETSAEFDYRGFLATVLETGFSPRAIALMWRTEMEREADLVGGRSPIGMLAAAYGDGARPDGSQQYGSIVRGVRPGWGEEGYGPEHGFRYYVEEVQAKQGRFRYAGDIDRRALDDLHGFVRLTQRAGVDLVVALLPHAPPVQRAVAADPQQRAFHDSVRSAVAGLCGPCEFHDLSDFASLGVAERHMLDGIHLDEFGWFAAWRRIAERSAILQGMVTDGAVAPLSARVDNARMFR